MANKWQVRWPIEVFNYDGYLSATIELSDEHCEDSNGCLHEVQVEIDVMKDLSINVYYVYDDEFNDWKGIPKYLERQIVSEAKKIYKCGNNENYLQMLRDGKLKLKNVNGL